jgi:hypothetical protein
MRAFDARRSGLDGQLACCPHTNRVTTNAVRPIGGDYVRWNSLAKCVRVRWRAVCLGPDRAATSDMCGIHVRGPGILSEATGLGTRYKVEWLGLPSNFVTGRSRGFMWFET